MAKKILNPDLQFDDEADEEGVAEQLEPGEIAAVVTGTDWTTETIVSQLTRGNIQLNPRFQRRDAWKQDRKSRFIESLIVGLPIPQIVLAEAKRQRGKFIVLDGKQRLLTILQFWGNGEGTNNEYRLSGSRIKDNHGIKEANVLSLFVPLGIPASAFGSTLLPSLQTFGELRGEHAHHSGKAVISAVDPETEWKRIEQLSVELASFDAWCVGVKKAIR